MSYKNANALNFDWLIIGIYLILVLIGWACIYAVSYEWNRNGFDFSSRAGIQIIWIVSSVCIAFVLLVIKSDWYEITAFWIYTAVILLLIVTIFVSTPIKGSRSWLILGRMRIQPAEFAKFATALVIAKVMNSKYCFNISRKENMAKLVGLIFLPIVLILLQQEAGSALVFVIFFFVFYREGMSGKILFSGFSIILLFVFSLRYSYNAISNISLGKILGIGFIIFCVMGFLLLHNYAKELKHVKYLFYWILVGTLISILILIFTSFSIYWIVLFLFISTLFYFLVLFIKNRDSIYLFNILFISSSFAFLYSTDYIFDKILELHQKLRIQVVLGVLDDSTGAGYNVNQSKIAIGSGGFMGKGYLKGTQTRLKFVPEQETDFIFCTIGEEMGFVGSVATLILFSVLIIRLLWLAEKQQRAFDRVYGYSVACIIFFHCAVNIGMVLGMIPVIGIPLPFFSYGGSSLCSFTILLFIFLRLDSSGRRFLRK